MSNSSIPTIGDQLSALTSDAPVTADAPDYQVETGQATPDNAATKSANFAMYSVPSAVLGFADTVGNSLGASPNAVSQAVGSVLPSLTSYYQRNQSWAQPVGDIAGSFAVGSIAAKAVESGSALYQAVSAGGRIPYVDALFASGQAADAALDAASARSAYLAGQGSRMVTGDTMWKGLRNQYLSTTALNGVKKAVAFELGTYALENKSETLFPAEQSFLQQMALPAAGVVGTVGLEYFAARRMIARTIADTSELASEVRNPLSIDTSNQIFRDGTRDTSLGVTALQWAANLSVASDNGWEAANPLLFKNLNADNLQFEKTLGEQTDKLAGQNTVFGETGVIPSTSLDDSQQATMKALYKNNPAAIIGTDALTSMPATSQDLNELLKTTIPNKVGDLQNQLVDVQGQLSKLKPGNIDWDTLSQQEQQLNGKINAFQTAEPVVFNADGSVQAAANRRVRASDSDSYRVTKKPASSFDPAYYVIDNTQNSKIKPMAVTSQFDLIAPDMVNKIGPGDINKLGDLNLQLNTGTLSHEEAAAASTIWPQPSQQMASQFGKLNFDQRSQAFLGFQRAIDEYVPGAQKIYLNDASHWTKFDAAQQVIAKNPDALSDFAVPSSAMSDPLGYMQLQSLRGKYQEFNQLMDYQEGNYLTAKGSIASKLTQKVSQDDMGYMLNLPPNTLNDASPVMKVFGNLRIAGAEDLASAIPDAGTFRKAVQDNVTFPQVLDSVPKQDMPIFGNSMSIAPGSKPLLAIKRPMQATDYTRDALELKMADDRNISLNYLNGAGQYGGDIVQAAFQRMAANPDTQQAKNIGRLVAGTTPGDGQDVITLGRYSAWNDTLRGLNDMSSDLQRVTDHQVNQLYSRPVFNTGSPNDTVSAYINAARARQNYGDLFKWGEFVQSRRFGWDLERDIVNNSDGTFSYKLSDTPFNQKQMEKYFPGTQWDHGNMMMPSMLPGDVYKPYVATEGAMQLQKSVNVLTDAYHGNASALKMAVGEGPLPYKQHWVPPIDLRNQHVSYITRGAGEPVTVVAGHSESEMNRLLDQEMANSGGSISRVLSPQDVKNYYDVMDQAFLGKINYVDALQQTGRAKGGLGTRTMRDPLDTLNSTMTTINGQLGSIGRRTKILYFEPQLNQVRAMQQTSGAAPNTLQKTGDATIWQKYMSMVADSTALNSQTPIGRIYSGIEAEMDHSLNVLYDRYLQSGLPDIINSFRNKRDFEALQKQIPDFNPLKDATDFASTVYRGAAPPTSRELFGKLNSITTKMTIRWLEVGNFLQQSFSTMAIMPAVMKGLQRMDGESEPAWISRIGAYGVPVGSDIAQFSPIKLLTNAMGDFFSPEGRKTIDAAAANGMFDTNHLDLYHTLHGGSTNWWTDMAAKADRWSSSLTYKGDQWSRMVAYLAGHRLADHLGYTDEIAKQGFANKIANLAVGDFRSVNRPQIFQGAVGMPLGLFQTFIWNYYQRMMGYVENKQLRALATQYAMQASVFGMQSVPGWDQFNEYLGTANQKSLDHSTSVVDAMRNHLGETVTDMILHGAPSTISGINLAARGNTNVPSVPTIGTPMDTPIANLAKQTFGAVKDVYDSFRATGGISTQDMLEIAARHSISRPLRGLLEVVNGRTTDQAGAVISDQTRSALGVISRMLDLRSTQEANTQEAYYQAQANRESQKIKMDRLTEVTRAAFRNNGGIDGDTIKKALVGYIDAGGDPRAMGRWVRDQATTALIPKATRDFMKSLREPAGLQDALRYTQMGVFQPNDPEYTR